jgi:hypothetical protein
MTVTHFRRTEPRTGLLLERSAVVAWQAGALVVDSLALLSGILMSYLAWRASERKKLPVYQWTLATMFHGVTTLSAGIAVACVPFRKVWLAVFYVAPFGILTDWQSRALVSVIVAIFVWWLPMCLRECAAQLRTLHSVLKRGGTIYAARD